MEKGGVIDAGTHEATTLEEMGVPNWVIEQDLCPGLPNWEALKDCHENFTTADSGGKGRWLEGPQSWHGNLMPTGHLTSLTQTDSHSLNFLHTKKDAA